MCMNSKALGDGIVAFLVTQLCTYLILFLIAKNIF